MGGTLPPASSDYRLPVVRGLWSLLRDSSRPDILYILNSRLPIKGIIKGILL
jgi:hypothetical protein